MPEESICGIGSVVAQRKTLIALNISYACCTGEPLFDYFYVIKQPERVLYLCPEMGVRAFTDRVRKIGLLPYVGKTLFYRTMSMKQLEHLRSLFLGYDDPQNHKCFLLHLMGVRYESRLPLHHHLMAKNARSINMARAPNRMG